MNYEKYIEKLHSIYLYPARYKWRIPNIIIEILKREGKKGLLFDPFAGSGTLAIEAYRNCYDSVSWDINPMLQVLVEAKKLLISTHDIDFDRLKSMLFDALNYSGDFLPYNGLIKWYPKEALTYIRRLWAYHHRYVGYFDINSNGIIFREEISPLFTIIALELTRRLSYTDDSIYKYYRSRFKKDKLKNILSKQGGLENYIEKCIDRKVRQLESIYRYLPKVGCNVSCDVKILIDTISNIRKAPTDILAVVTSPPYLIAHEYIRSFRYDLVWLGIPLSIIRRISHYEIPYNKSPSVDIISPTYIRYRSVIREAMFKKNVKTNILNIYENYFNSIIYVFSNLADKLTKGGYLAIFVGEATLAGIRIPIHRILIEHLESQGLVRVEQNIRKDKIRNRRLFLKRKNRNPNGIRYEYLIILKHP